ncbi:MAG: histidine triad nucleotide-binding protein [Dehalococcoidia bacterium]|nr:MAG: histidine triad nucleotide-binding protein [Dehalococcoidia bacterium]
MDCIFCKIIAGAIPTKFVYQDKEVIAFRDIEPQAPVHILIIPREHIASLAEVPESKSGLLGHLVAVANKLAKSEGIAERGYRVAINCGPEGTQGVPHIHLHLLGGRQLSGMLG